MQYAVAYLGPWVVPGIRWVDVHLAEEVHVKGTVEVCPLVAQPAPHQVEAVLVPPTGLAWPPVSPGEEEAWTHHYWVSGEGIPVGNQDQLPLCPVSLPPSQVPELSSP